MPVDLYDTATFANGHPVAAYDALRSQSGLHWNPEPNGPGYWAVTRYEDVYVVDRDYKTYSSEPTIMIDDPHAKTQAATGEAKMMLMMDPPQHTRFRQLIRPQFTHAAAAEKIARLDDLARQIIDNVIDRGTCDFVADVAGEMPSYVIAELMGIPLEDGRKLYQLTETIHAAPESVAPGAGHQAVMEMFGYASTVIAEKRARPKDDLATRLLQAEFEGRGLTDQEFLLFFLLLIDAGGDTTRNLLSTGLYLLLQNPDQLRWLMGDLENRLPAAREELTRLSSPVIYMRRTATCDTELNGTKISRGQKVVMYFGAANRDPKKFDRPNDLDLQRAENDHLAFGTGPHACLGKHLARFEIDAVLLTVLRRMKNIELVGQPAWLPSTFISGPRSMPIRFRPA